jgi:hypothetical protein
MVASITLQSPLNRHPISSSIEDKGIGLFKQFRKALKAFLNSKYFYILDEYFN